MQCAYRKCSLTHKGQELSNGSLSKRRRTQERYCQLVQLSDDELLRVCREVKEDRAALGKMRRRLLGEVK